MCSSPCSHLKRGRITFTPQFLGARPRLPVKNTPCRAKPDLCTELWKLGVYGGNSSSNLSTQGSVNPASAKFRSQELRQCLSPVEFKVTLTEGFISTASSRQCSPNLNVLNRSSRSITALGDFPPSPVSSTLTRIRVMR